MSMALFSPTTTPVILQIVAAKRASPIISNLLDSALRLKPKDLVGKVKCLDMTLIPRGLGVSAGKIMFIGRKLIRVTENLLRVLASPDSS